MRSYLKAISIFQNLLLTIGISVLLVLPLCIMFNAAFISQQSVLLYDVVHITVFFVMAVRPLADIFTNTILIRPLVILRKGFGVLSASIVVSFILAKCAIDPIGYVSSFGTGAYWSLAGNALLAHLADITAVLLLITSNNFSKRMLGKWWKRIQRLSYVYFFSSGLYVYLSFGETRVLVYMIIVTLLTIVAFFKNRAKRAAVIPTNV